MAEFYPWALGVSGALILLLLAVIGRLLLNDRKDIKTSVLGIATSVEGLRAELRDALILVQGRQNVQGEKLDRLLGEHSAIHGLRGENVAS